MRAIKQTMCREDDQEINSGGGSSLPVVAVISLIVESDGVCWFEIFGGGEAVLERVKERNGQMTLVLVNCL